MEDLAIHVDSALFDTVFDGVVVIDPGTLTVARANRAAAAILGFESPEEMIGLEPFATILPEDRHRAASLFAAVASGQAMEEGVEVRVTDRRRQEIWILARGQTLPVNGGTMLLASFRDVTALKRAEIALRQAEERQIELLNSSNELILITQDWKIVFVNHRLEAMTNASGRSMVGMSIIDVTHPDDREKVRRGYQKLLDGTPTAPGRPLKGYARNGKEAWGLTRHIPFTWQGKPALMTVIQDVTQRVREEEALRQSEQKYRELAEKTTDIIWTADLGFRITYMSPSVERILGRTPAEVTGHLMQDFVAPASWQHIQGVMAEQRRLEMEGAGDRDAVVRTETESYRRDGSSVWLENLASGIRDSGGGLVGIYGISRDVTERRRVEEEARLAAQEWQETFDSVSDMISVLDRDGRIIRANKAFVDSLGVKPDEISGRRCHELVHESATYWPGCPYRRCLAQKKPCAEELWEPRLGKFLQVSVSPVFNSRNEVAGAVHVVRDLTQRKKTEEALQLSEGHFRALVENSAAVVFSLDLEANITDISPAIERMSGFRPGELIGTSALNWALPEDVPGLLRGVEGTLEGRREPFEFRVHFKNGSVHHMLMSGRPTYRDEKLSGLLGVMVDVTDARSAEQALKASEANYRSLFENTLMGLEVIDLETMKTVLANEPMASIFGFESAAAMVGLEPLDFVVPDDLDAVIAELARVVANPGTHAMRTFRVRARDGRTVWVTAMANAFEFVCRPSLLLSVLDVTAEKEAQLKVAESEEKNRQIIDNAAEGIIVIQDGFLKFANPKASQISGYAGRELLSRSFLEMVHPDDRQMIAENYSSRIAGRPAPNNYRFRIIDNAGHARWLQINTVQSGWEGRPAVLAMLTDVSAMKEAEDALRDSESRYRLITENSSDVIWTMDMNLRMTYVSPSVEKLTGFTPGESVAMDMTSTMTQGSLDRATRYLAEGLAGRNFAGTTPVPEMMELEMLCKDGSSVWTEVQMSFMQDTDGRLVGVMGVARNISERRRAEQAVRTSEERFRNLVEATSDWVWETDSGGVYTYASPKVREVLGYEVGEIVGRSIFDHMPATDSPRFAATFRSAAAGREPFSFVENSRLHKDGRVVVMETSGVPFFANDGGLLGYRGIGRDITNRKKVERDLENSLKKVEKTMEAAIQAISYTMETRDPYTTGHQRRVTQLACAIAKEMGMGRWQIDGIRVAGLLHDIGKIAVPTEILSKPGKLSDMEFSLIKAHPRVGFDILANVEFEWPIARIVVQHHERMDGSGYPFGTRGKDILLEARILAVADVVEAMSSHRPYRSALGLDKALDEVARGQGTIYDPEVVRACGRVISEHGFKFEG